MDFHVRGVFVPTPLIFHPELSAVEFLLLRSHSFFTWFNSHIYA